MVIDLNFHDDQDTKIGMTVDAIRRTHPSQRIRGVAQILITYVI